MSALDRPWTTPAAAQKSNDDEDGGDGTTPEQSQRQQERQRHTHTAPRLPGKLAAHAAREPPHPYPAATTGFPLNLLILLPTIAYHVERHTFATLLRNQGTDTRDTAKGYH